MSDEVSFNEPQYEARGAAQSGKPSWMAKFVIESGLAKDQRSADRILLIAALLIAIAAIAVYVFLMPSTPPPVPVP